MATIKPTPYTMSQIKSKLLRPAMTSHFLCQFNVPPALVSWYQQKDKAFDKEIPELNFNDSNNLELINLSCAEATLPGSTLYTHDVMDYTGVTEKIPYRRVYDDRADFTFYVDSNYKIIKFFEFWIQYIVDEQYTKLDSGGLANPYYSYRVNYPDGDGNPTNTQRGYRTNISLLKFDRDYGGLEKELPNQVLNYTYINAYPISIMSMPVSYDASEVLKCTVSFTYTRYVISRQQVDKISDPNPKPIQSSSNQLF